MNTYDIPASSTGEQITRQAIQHHKSGLLKEAEHLYRSIAQEQSHGLDADYNLESLLIQKELVALFIAKHFTEATSQAKMMMARFPRNGFGWMMMGMLTRQEGKNAEALDFTQKGAALSPGYAAAHYNHGIILIELERLEEAEACFRMALQIKPDYAEAVNNLGCILKRLHRIDEAVSCFRQALQIKPGWAEVYGNLGLLFQDQGRLDEALACFQQQIRLTPENSTVQHIIASLTGSNPERAPAQYVEKSFNNPHYANNFDTHLQHTLRYDAPRKFLELVLRHATLSPATWDVLDLGCGTGLVGVEIAPYARQLVGVDLSSKMLEKASSRNIYQRLECSDLLTMMQAEPALGYDAIFALDVFVYLGRLDEIIGEVKRLLRPGGFFIFSVEDLITPRSTESGRGMQRGYQLENTGRYTHSADYLSSLASAGGFLILEMVAIQLRVEEGRSVKGHLVLWQS